jgi:LacI family transcriptional regulator
LVNASRAPAALHAHPTIPTYVAGCEARAEKLGYSFDRFWLHDPSLKASSWLRVMHTRGIKGIILVGLMDSNCLPEHLAPVWKEIPTVVTGVRTRNPALPFACVDHHGLIIDAFERAAALGYRRPALAIDDVIDRLVGRRFSAGFISAQADLPRANRLPIFSSISDA